MPNYLAILRQAYAPIREEAVHAVGRMFANWGGVPLPLEAKNLSRHVTMLRLCLRAGQGCLPWYAMFLAGAAPLLSDVDKALQSFVSLVKRLAEQDTMEGIRPDDLLENVQSVAAMQSPELSNDIFLYQTLWRGDKSRAAVAEWIDQEQQAMVGAFWAYASVPQNKAALVMFYGLGIYWREALVPSDDTKELWCDVIDHVLLTPADNILNFDVYFSQKNQGGLAAFIENTDPEKAGRMIGALTAHARILGLPMHSAEEKKVTPMAAVYTLYASMMVRALGEGPEALAAFFEKLCGRKDFEESATQIVPLILSGLSRSQVSFVSSVLEEKLDTMDDITKKVNLRAVYTQYGGKIPGATQIFGAAPEQPQQRAAI